MLDRWVSYTRLGSQANARQPALPRAGRRSIQAWTAMTETGTPVVAIRPPQLPWHDHFELAVTMLCRIGLA